MTLFLGLELDQEKWERLFEIQKNWDEETRIERGRFYAIQSFQLVKHLIDYPRSGWQTLGKGGYKKNSKKKLKD